MHSLDKQTTKGIEMSAVKFHAAKQNGAFAWVACGTEKTMAAKGNTMHGGCTTVAEFKKLPASQQCKKCAAKISQLKL